MEPASTLRAVESALLSRRRAQHLAFTLGDDGDRALADALVALPGTEHAPARDVGIHVGSEVFARRCIDDTLERGAVFLRSAVGDSGWGALVLESTFHRSARLRFVPAPTLAAAHPQVRASFVEGILQGFFASTLNCAAHVTSHGEGTLAVELGDGRNVNDRGVSG